MRQEIARPDAAIARIGSRQHGVVSFEQLLWAGLSPSGISRRLQGGRLHRIHRGVYAVGHTDLDQEGRWLAAILACGEGAALGFDSAAALWGMLTLPRSSPAHVVERLVVEVDGYVYLSDRTAFEADRRRDRELQARGFVVVRVTYREALEEPKLVVEALIPLL